MPFVCSLPTLRRTILSVLLLLFTAGLVAGIFVPSAQAADKLTIYSGRSERLIKPVLDAYGRAETTLAAVSEAHARLAELLELFAAHEREHAV